MVLVELDLRRPTFTEHFGLEPGRGLTTALTGERPGRRSCCVEPLADVPNLLRAARRPASAQPLGAPRNRRLAEIISEARATTESMVIVDAPPLNPVADAQVLLNRPP